MYEKKSSFGLNGFEGKGRSVSLASTGGRNQQTFFGDGDVGAWLFFSHERQKIVCEALLHGVWTDFVVGELASERRFLREKRSPYRFGLFILDSVVVEYVFECVRGRMFP